MYMKKICFSQEAKIAIVSLLLYALNKFFLYRIIENAWFKNYFNDIMGGIVFGSALCIAFRYWFKREITLLPYIIIILFAGIYWEYIAPLYLKYSVSDVVDMVAYLGGGFILQIVLKVWGYHNEM